MCMHVFSSRLYVYSICSQVVCMYVCVSAYNSSLHSMCILAGCVCGMFVLPGCIYVCMCGSVEGCMRCMYTSVPDPTAPVQCNPTLHPRVHTVLISGKYPPDPVCHIRYAHAVDVWRVQPTFKRVQSILMY